VVPRWALVIAVSLPLACGGCARIGDLETAPQQSFTSAKSPDVLAGCIAEAWSTSFFATSPAVYQPRPDGAVVAVPHPLAGVDAVARIHRTAAGSRVDYAERMPAVSLPWMADGVQGCL